MRNGQRVRWSYETDESKVWVYVGRLPKLPEWPPTDQHVIYENSSTDKHGEPTYGELKIVNGCHLSPYGDGVVV